MSEFGVIGGSGVYNIPGLEITDEVSFDTPYGSPSDRYRIGLLAGKEIVFLPRHGTGHSIQPHRINYRANIWGFRELGVKRLLSVGASGGINPGMKPGVLVMPDQIIDHTSGRQATFFDRDEVLHIDFTEPFCPVLRKHLLDVASGAGLPHHDRGTYICVNGPRLETAAEIRTFAGWGADVVGMTAMPEAVLAREAGLCYAIVSVVTNYAAGTSADKLTATEVKETMAASEEKLRELLTSFFGLSFAPPACYCAAALDQARM